MTRWLGSCLCECGEGEEGKKKGGGELHVQKWNAETVGDISRVERMTRSKSRYAQQQKEKASIAERQRNVENVFSESEMQVSLTTSKAKAPCGSTFPISRLH